MGAPCIHLKETGSGCAIYASRPGVCKRFVCGWIQGEDTVRPDRLGAVYWHLTMQETGRTLVMLEVASAALSKEDAVRFRNRVLGDGIPVLSVPIQGAVELYLPRRFMLLTTLSESAIEDGRRIQLVHL